MDGLFTGPASERRRFLDRLIPCFDPGYRTRLGQFERAMQQRNRLLAEDVREPARFAGLERIMAETGVAIAAARAAAVAELAAAIAARREAATESAFPWAELAIAGTLGGRPGDATRRRRGGRLRRHRCEARASATAPPAARSKGRTAPTSSSATAPRHMPASVCSTGEQKALLIGLVLAHADLVRQRRDGAAPILLLDEIAAHLDPLRRAALFDEIVALGGQTWMTGTDPAGLLGPCGTGAIPSRRGRPDRRSADAARRAPITCHKSLKITCVFRPSLDLLFACFRRPFCAILRQLQNSPKRTSR